MSTLNQLVKVPRKKIVKNNSKKFLYKCPQKRAVCIKVYTTKPKKPHSAIRKIAKVYILSKRRHVLAYIPGQGHNLTAHSLVMLRGGRVRDIPGMHCKILRNKLDFTFQEALRRTRRRSKYGLRRLKL